jgi:hypothetical protein
VKPTYAAALALAFCLVIAPQLAAAQNASRLVLRPPTLQEVSWRGMLPTEGGNVGMGPQIGMYPAPGVAGLLAAIFTHAAINQGVQSAQQKQAQEAADRVLGPYLPALRGWPAAALWTAAVAQTPAVASLKAEGAKSGEDDVEVDAVPSFTLAQDEGVLIADVAVRLEAGAAGATPIERVVRVISSPHGAADARAHWLADEARPLKTAAAAMLAHAVHLAQKHGAHAAGEIPMRTHRYLQGSVERVERAQLLAGNCARAVLLTLRGALMSVPLRSADEPACKRSEAF